MTSDQLRAYLIGIAVTAAIYFVLRRQGSPTRNALALFAGACGLLTTLFLLEDSSALRAYSAEIVATAVTVVLALLVFARKRLSQ